MVNEHVEDIRNMYVKMIYRDYVSVTSLGYICVASLCPIILLKYNYTCSGLNFKQIK